MPLCRFGESNVHTVLLESPFDVARYLLPPDDVRTTGAAYFSHEPCTQYNPRERIPQHEQVDLTTVLDAIDLGRVPHHCPTPHWVLQPNLRFNKSPSAAVWTGNSEGQAQSRPCRQYLHTNHGSQPRLQQHPELGSATAQNELLVAGQTAIARHSGSASIGTTPGRLFPSPSENLFPVPKRRTHQGTLIIDCRLMVAAD